MAVCGSCDAREWRENTQQGTLADRGGVSLRGPSVAGWPDGQGEDPSSEVLVVTICSPKPMRAVP